MMHDFALTERYAIFMDLPVVFDTMLGLRGKFPYKWSDRYGARLGIRRSREPGAAVRWLDIEPCYVFHVFNAFEDGEQIVMDVVRYKELWRNGNGLVLADDAAPFHDRPRGRSRERSDARRAFERVSAHRRAADRQPPSLRLYRRG